VGSDGNKTGKITIETVRKAIMGAQIKNNYEMYVYYKGIPQECQDAIEAIRDHYAEFEKLLWDQLSALRLTKKFFGRLIRARLKQRDILASPIVSAIFDDSRRLERRLESIQSIRGVEELRREYRSSSDPARGDETDWLIRDLLAEILTLDFLKQLDFSGICKVREESNKAHIDIVAQRKGKFYAIEVTRKKEIQGWETLEQPLGHNIGLEDCDDATNQKEICRLLRNALQSKADQFSRALDSGTIDHSMAKVVAIKTSDYGFAECIDQAEQIARELLSDPNAWSPVDCTWLLPNVDALQSRWVYGKTADVVRN
jgi:hypothetical protein